MHLYIHDGVYVVGLITKPPACLNGVVVRSVIY